MKLLINSETMKVNYRGGCEITLVYLPTPLMSALIRPHRKLRIDTGMFAHLSVLCNAGGHVGRRSSRVPQFTQHIEVGRILACLSATFAVNLGLAQSIMSSDHNSEGGGRNIMMGCFI